MAGKEAGRGEWGVRLGVRGGEEMGWPVERSPEASGGHSERLEGSQKGPTGRPCGQEEVVGVFPCG